MDLSNKMDENYIRRERRRKLETKRAVEEMRAALKVCDMDDVRRHKLPFHEALLIGLEEKGYNITAMFIQQLIDMQTEMTEKAGPSSVLWTKPQLKNTKTVLKIISDGLMKAEEFRKKDDWNKECETFLKVAAHIAFLNQDWWWLGEQLLLQSISISEEYTMWDGKYEALSRYAYAKFLIENFKETETAHENLTVVRELSSGKKWAASQIFPSDKDSLYANANYLLHVCLMHEARSLMKTNYSEAIRLATLARKRAAEACYLGGETKALLLKGTCEVNAKNPTAAIATFTKAFYIQERIGNLEGVCATKLQLAQAYLMNGDTLLSLKTLMKARKCAAENNLTYFLAQSYRHLGEFYLNNGEPKRATPLLGEALKIFHETDYIYESEQVRNLEAISTGLELFPKYIKLLTDTSHPETGLENLMKMVEWKDSRKQFWSQDDESTEPSSQVSDEDEEEDRIEEEAIRFKKISLEEHEEQKKLEHEVIQLHTNIDAFHPESTSTVAFSNYEDDQLSLEEMKMHHDKPVLEVKSSVFQHEEQQQVTIREKHTAMVGKKLVRHVEGSVIEISMT